jgi:FixJ family two-component response regulator
MSSMAFVTGSAEAIETGGRNFLKKPVSKEKLVDAIQGRYRLPSRLPC